MDLFSNHLIMDQKREILLINPKQSGQMSRVADFLLLNPVPAYDHFTEAGFVFSHATAQRPKMADMISEVFQAGDLAWRQRMAAYLVAVAHDQGRHILGPGMTQEIEPQGHSQADRVRLMMAPDGSIYELRYMLGYDHVAIYCDGQFVRKHSQIERAAQWVQQCIDSGLAVPSWHDADLYRHVESDELPWVIATHDGEAHADEVMGATIASDALASRYGASQRPEVIRTRHQLSIATSTLAIDIGMQFEPAAGRLDHHQPGAPVRPDGTPYAAAGLCWRAMGAEYVGDVLINETILGFRQAVRYIAGVIDEQIMAGIDARDTGHRKPRADDPYNISNILVDAAHADFGNSLAAYDAFLRAMDTARQVLHNAIWRAYSAWRAIATVDRIIAEMPKYPVGHIPRWLHSTLKPRDMAKIHGQILELPRRMVWSDAVARHPHIKAVIWESENQWNIQAVSGRLVLPSAWLDYELAAQAAGVATDDIIFVHKAAFFAATTSHEAARGLAVAAIAGQLMRS